MYYMILVSNSCNVLTLPKQSALIVSIATGQMASTSPDLYSTSLDGWIVLFKAR